MRLENMKSVFCSLEIAYALVDISVSNKHFRLIAGFHHGSLLTDTSETTAKLAFVAHFVMLCAAFNDKPFYLLCLTISLYNLCFELISHLPILHLLVECALKFKKLHLTKYWQSIALTTT